jgi:glycoprotein endo-alpha-1,2-mannosidase
MKFAAIITLILLAGLVTSPSAESAVSSRLHAFYYPWYGTPEQDSVYIHWRHDVLGDGVPHTYPGGDDIGADFYPLDGCYSSSDPEILNRQMHQLNQAGIGVISVSWLGIGSFEASSLDLLMDIAAENKIAVNFHLEPAVQTSIETVRDAIVYLIDTYRNHPAFYRDTRNAPNGLFYVYDSHTTPASQWARLLTPAGDLTIRGTRWDTALLGLLLNESDKAFIEASGMDGAYAYFAVDGFTYGSTSANWPALVRWAESRDLLFVPSVGPGYRDQRIRPWNGRNWRDREAGGYYDCMFARAIAANPQLIGITSFNEWHEGTQIEPAMPFATSEFEYRDYRPLAPDDYLHRTAYWRERLEAAAGEALTLNPGDLSRCGGGASRQQVDHLAVGSLATAIEQYGKSYSGGGDNALVDGVTGSNNYRDGCWQGFEGTDVHLTLALSANQAIAELRLGFLRDSLAWIFLPHSVTIEAAIDGVHFEPLTTVPVRAASGSIDPLRHELFINLDQNLSGAIRFTIRAQRTCPQHHAGAGKPAWLFIDEIQVQ